MYFRCIRCCKDLYIQEFIIHNGDALCLNCAAKYCKQKVFDYLNKRRMKNENK